MNQNRVQPEPGELPPKPEPSEPELADPKPNRTEPGFAIPDNSATQLRAMRAMRGSLPLK